MSLLSYVSTILLIIILIFVIFSRKSSIRVSELIVIAYTLIIISNICHGIIGSVLLILTIIIATYMAYYILKHKKDNSMYYVIVAILLIAYCVANICEFLLI